MSRYCMYIALRYATLRDVELRVTYVSYVEPTSCIKLSRMRDLGHPQEWNQIRSDGGCNRVHQTHWWRLSRGEPDAPWPTGDQQLIHCSWPRLLLLQKLRLMQLTRKSGHKMLPPNSTAIIIVDVIIIIIIDVLSSSIYRRRRRHYHNNRRRRHNHGRLHHHNDRSCHHNYGNCRRHNRNVCQSACLPAFRLFLCPSACLCKCVCLSVQLFWCVFL